jgi:ubiquinone/menaquinone biosynthesis C-methylase UbiE
MEEIKNIYNNISNDFDKTRYSVWNSVKIFLDSLESNSKILELGCGNGKNMLYRKDLDFIGIDISIEQVKICNNKNLNVIEGNIINLLFDDNKFNYMICIATYHHLDNDNHRQKALYEMYRCLKPNGLILLSVLAMEQPLKSKFKFTDKDSIVLWNNKYKRYYHIYKENDLKEEILRLNPNFIIKNYFFEEGNWYIILSK